MIPIWRPILMDVNKKDPKTKAMYRMEMGKIQYKRYGKVILLFLMYVTWLMMEYWIGLQNCLFSAIVFKLQNQMKAGCNLLLGPN